MAVGYSHTDSVRVLLEHGASPDASDRQGRTVAGLVDYIRSSMPLDRSTIGRRIQLEEVAALLAGGSRFWLPTCVPVLASLAGLSAICCLPAAGRGTSGDAVLPGQEACMRRRSLRSYFRPGGGKLVPHVNSWSNGLMGQKTPGCPPQLLAQPSSLPTASLAF